MTRKWSFSSSTFYNEPGKQVLVCDDFCMGHNLWWATILYFWWAVFGEEFVWRFCMADFGEEICMAVFGGGFWWGNLYGGFVWATIFGGRLVLWADQVARRPPKIVAHTKSSPTKDCACQYWLLEISGRAQKPGLALETQCLMTCRT